MKRKVLLIIFALAMMLACAATVSFADTDIEFTVDGAAATVENALTIKESPTYGDTWADIVKIKEGVTLVAKVAGDDSSTGEEGNAGETGDNDDNDDNDGTGNTGDVSNTGNADGAGNVSNTDSDQSHFRLKQTETPSAGDNQDWELVYSGTIGEQTYTNVTVLSGKVNVAKRVIKTKGFAAKNRQYDGTTIVELDRSRLAIDTGLYLKDVNDGTLSFSIPSTGTIADPYPSDEPKKVTGVSLTMYGMAKVNYTLADIDYITVIISKADPDVGTVTCDDTESLQVTDSLYDVAISRTGAAQGTIVFDEGQTLAYGTNDYTWTFTPNDTSNYNVATGKVSITVIDKLVGIAVKDGTEVTKKTYTTDDKFDITGATIEATYESGNKKDLAAADLAYSGKLVAGQTDVLITYTENGIEKTCTITGLTVTQARHSSGGSASKANSEVEKAKTEAKAEEKTEAEASKYDAKEASEVAAIQEQAEKDIADAKTVEEVKAIEAEAQAKIEAVLTTEEKAEIKTVKSVGKAVFKAKSTNSKLNGKKAVKITWSVPSKVDVDGFEVYRSEKKNSGYGTKPYFTTSKTSYTNNKELKAGTTYYYKVRAYKVINGEKVYTGWSTKACRTV